MTFRMRWLRREYTRLKYLLRKLYQFFEGAYRMGQLEDARSITRTDAEKAVDRILRTTGLPPDCVGATVIQGGCTIWITHTVNGKTTQEAFIHLTYAEAANKAIAWAKAKDVQVGGQSGYNRESRRAWGAKLKKARNRGKASE